MAHDYLNIKGIVCSNELQYKNNIQGLCKDISVLINEAECTVLINYSKHFHINFLLIQNTIVLYRLREGVATRGSECRL